MITAYTNDQMEPCAQLLVSAYNGPPWETRWTPETAKRYLQEFVNSRRFVGFVIWEGERIVGAAFGSEKTWWTQDELYVGEFFIAPDCQRRGLGKQLLRHLEEYVKRRGLAGITLLTNRHMPAHDFYLKNSLTDARHVVYMYKEL